MNQRRNLKNNLKYSKQNENTTDQNISDIMKTLLLEKFVALNA